MIPTFEEFMRTKPLYYDKFDISRMNEAYKKLSLHIAHPYVVHIIGTNGKGSTGRTMAHLAHKAGLHVGHYSSPHIFRFNERIWIDGSDVDDDTLQSAHERLYEILGSDTSDKLTYFEYSTLLALVIFEKLDFIIVEAGLGGEFDATNVIENRVLTVVTPIGMDHQAFLGYTIKDIAETKLRSMQKLTLLAKQPYEEVYKVAQDIASQKGTKLIYATDIEDFDVETLHLVRDAAIEHGWPPFIRKNILLAVDALNLLHIDVNLSHLHSLELFGRYYPLKENIHIDVGHNPLAAKTLSETIDNDTVLIYNTLNDKDFKTILEILKPKLKRVEIIPIENHRSLQTFELEKALSELNIPYDFFNGILFDHENYLVFGSFYTVEQFLRDLGFDL